MGYCSTVLNIICVNSNNYLGRGNEYVARLRAGVARHLGADYTFHVLTERDIPGTVQGWWAKLAMFQPGRFSGRCLYFDLDTVICGPLDDIASVDGPMHGIEDFYRPGRFASGVMSWTAEDYSHVWTQFERAGFPQFDPNGDQGWIETMVPDAKLWQREIPGQIVSFKADCLNGVPENARVIAFHGLPRPHTLRDIMAHW